MGLDINYFYSLTPRQFANIQKGMFEKRDAEQKERLILVRRLMFASLAPYSKGLTEQSLWSFDFEKELIEKANHRDDAEIAKQLEESIAFWQRVDAARGKA